ncbi:ATP-binding cassette domain-containing protein [Mycoplasmopsis agassizii]|uniref:ABC transporter domain-containing protein n=1 Tax=Mycoplasmopsis agassizii TaxID=33922 RepID=A0A269TKK8_9BACT|nr:ATP-binding cassette domain-containing protein [Mycoplasmopsis agassizii]PAK21305.1 hypothetical protein CJJ23_02610 [Mycoplasmopsis agassizii]
MLKILNASFKLQDQKNNVLKNINFEIEEGQIIAIADRKTSGESDFLKIFLKELILSEGFISYKGHDFEKLSKNVRLEYWKSIHYSSNLTYALEYETVYEELQRWIPKTKTIQKFFRLVDDEQDRKIYDVLTMVDLIPKTFAITKTLDPTSRAKLELGQLLISDKTFILADDPTSYIDSTLSSWYVEMVKDYCHKNKATMIFVSRDLDLLRDHFENFYYLDNRKLRKASKAEFLKLIEENKI